MHPGSGNWCAILSAAELLEQLLASIWMSLIGRLYSLSALARDIWALRVALAC